MSRSASDTLYSGRNTTCSRPRTAGSPSMVAGQVIDELDDQLGEMIGGRGLAGEEERPRRHLQVRVLPQPVVEHHDAQGVEKLPFVFMDALDLAIEDGVRIHGLPGGGFEPLGELSLASRLALRKSLRKPLSSANGLSLLNWVRSVIQPSPMASVIVLPGRDSPAATSGAA